MMMMRDEPTAAADLADAMAGLCPERREYEGASGTPAVLSDGQTWLLADGGLRNALDGLRDRIDDEARLRGDVSMLDVSEAAGTLLRANYRLSIDEAADLVFGAPDGDALTAAVLAALFGPPAPRRTYTNWATSALLANGIDPASIPGDLRPHVLAQLVRTGRAIPVDEFVDSAVAAPQLAAIRDRVARSTPPA